MAGHSEISELRETIQALRYSLEKKEFVILRSSRKSAKPLTANSNNCKI